MNLNNNNYNNNNKFKKELKFISEKIDRMDDILIFFIEKLINDKNYLINCPFIKNYSNIIYYLNKYKLKNKLIILKEIMYENKILIYNLKDILNYLNINIYKELV
jgi:hypothetical protein